MKNKNMVIAGLVVVILVIVSLIVFLVTKGSDKNNNKDNKKDNKKQDTKYEIDDEKFDRITIGNIAVEVIDDQTIVNFTIKNNSDEVYPEGLKTFSIEETNVPATEEEYFISSIEPRGKIDVEIVINGIHKNIDRINIVE